MNPFGGIPDLGDPVAWIVYADVKAPEFTEVHWGTVNGWDGDEVEILDETSCEVFWMHKDHVPYVPGFEPKPRSVWD